MKDMTIAYTTPVLHVNGLAFEVLKGDAEILDDMAELDEKIGLAKTDAERRRLKAEGLRGEVDAVLGEGAFEKIFDSIKGAPKNTRTMAAAKLCEKIVGCAAAVYAQSFAVSYGEELAQ